MSAFEGFDATGKSAQAFRYQDGNRLIADLFNTATDPTLFQSDVLTAVFFNTSQSVAEAGSTLTMTGSSSHTSSDTGTFNAGFSASGLGVFANKYNVAHGAFAMGALGVVRGRRKCAK